MFSIQSEQIVHIPFDDSCKHMSIFRVDDPFLGRDFTFHRGLNQLNIRRGDLLVKPERGVPPQLCSDISFRFKENQATSNGLALVPRRQSSRTIAEPPVLEPAAAIHTLASTKRRKGFLTRIGIGLPDGSSSPINRRYGMHVGIKDPELILPGALGIKGLKTC